MTLLGVQFIVIECISFYNIITLVCIFACCFGLYLVWLAWLLESGVELGFRVSSG